jgi:hypothetical protein
VYIGNLDETWSEERLRQDFSEYGEIELVNTLREKSCAFVNFTNIANAIKAIEAVRGKDEYRKFKVNFGKDRCGNPPRQMQQQSPRGDQAPSPPANGSSQNGNSPTGGQGGAQSAALFNTNSNPLTMYLNHVSQQAQQQQHQQHHVLAAQQAALFGTAASSPNEPGLTLEVPQGPISGHHQQSASISNGYITNMATSSGATTVGGLLAPVNSRASHNRAVSLPVFAPGFENGGNSPSSMHGSMGGDGGEQQRRGHQYQASFGGMGAGYGLGLQGNLNGWVEEEVAN